MWWCFTKSPWPHRGLYSSKQNTLTCCHHPGPESLAWGAHCFFARVSIHTASALSHTQTLSHELVLGVFKEIPSAKRSYDYSHFLTWGKGDSERLNDLSKAPQLLTVMLDSKIKSPDPKSVFFLFTAPPLFRPVNGLIPHFLISFSTALCAHDTQEHTEL